MPPIRYWNMYMKVTDPGALSGTLPFAVDDHSFGLPENFPIGVGLSVHMTVHSGENVFPLPGFMHCVPHGGHCGMCVQMSWTLDSG